MTRRFTAGAFAATASLLMIPALASATAVQAGEVHADLKSASGERVASLTGSVNAKGTGFGTIAPLSGAGAHGLKRVEPVKLYAFKDGTIRVSGQRGTYITLSDRTHDTLDGSGTINVADRKLRTVRVSAAGSWESSPFHPKKGMDILVIGKTGGAIRAALGKRYHLVNYNDTVHSRDALIANPERYKHVAGMLVGKGVSASQLRTMDLARSMYNEGRFVATTAKPKVFDRFLYHLTHAHVGNQGVILRREAPALGAMVHSYPQIRQPILTHSRLGKARAKSEAETFPLAERKNAAKKGIAHMTAALAKSEVIAPKVKGKKKTEMTTSSSTDPATVTAGTTDAAYYTVPIDQYVTVAITLYSPVTGLENKQTVGVTYNPIYTVSLAQSTSEVTQQAVSETNAVQFDALANTSDSLANGTYNFTTGIVTPSESSENTEGGWGLAMAYHSVVMQCVSCVGTSGGTITPTFESGASAPTQQVTQVSGGSSTGTSTSSSASSSWSASNSTTSSWDVSATVGMFGPIPTGSVTTSGGQSYTTSSSTGGGTSQGTGTSVNSSINYTLSNWTTTPNQGATQAQYTTYSTTLTGASGTASAAAYSLPFPSTLTSNTGGFISTPSTYLGDGPGPTCSTLVSSGSDSCSPTTMSPQPYGSGENVNGFTQGSTSYFTLDSSGNQLGTGSVTPWVADNFYLFDSGFFVPPCGESTCTAYPFGGYAEVQILGQSTVKVASNVQQRSIAATDTATATGTGQAGGITTYYSSTGGVVNSSASASYATIGLDLCAPPVLTPALWNAGCQNDPDFSGPPAVYAQGPTISTSSTTNPLQTNASTGQSEVAAPAPALSCSSGSWSGSPSYTYQWQQWNATFGDWQNISGATSSTYTPSPSLSASTYFLCAVTSTNSIGSATTESPSVEVIVG